MTAVQEITKIHITNVQIIPDHGKYLVHIDYSDGKYDEFGPYESYEEAKSVVYWNNHHIERRFYESANSWKH